MTPHSPSGSPGEASDPQPEHKRPTRRERLKIRNRVRALTHAINTMDLTLTPQRRPPAPAPSEREQLQALLRLYRRARASPQVSNNPQPSLVTLLIIMLSLASSAQAFAPPASPMLLLLAPLLPSGLSNPQHQPYNWTVHTMGGIEKDLLYNVTAGAPSFTTSICNFFLFTDLNNNHWLRNQCQSNLVSGFYICPSTGKGCADPSHFYCPSWGCETMAYGWSGAPNKDQHLQISWANKNWRHITLTVKNPNEDNWFSGRTYGLRLYMEGYDWGGLFSIQKRPPTTTNPSGIGPNVVLNPKLSNPLPSSNTPATSSTAPTPPRQPLLPPPRYSSPLLGLIQAAFTSVNSSHPNLTSSCWLCLSTSSPLYEPVASNLTFSESTEEDPTNCNWNTLAAVPLTFHSISSTGQCIRPRSTNSPNLTACANYSSPYSSTKFLVPHNSSQWLCSSTGLTPCLNVATLNKTNEICLLIVLVPRVLYHSEEDFFLRLERTAAPATLQKREPITALTIASLLGLAGASTGATQSSALTHLREAVDEDIRHLQSAISHLKNSVNSLSEVVPQNRQGLDLLLLKEGGLCAALGEECCIYANSTGLAEDSLKKVQEGLEQRQREREAANYFSGVFHTLLPYLLPFLGPLIIIILALTIGPWAVRRIVQLSKTRPTLSSRHLCKSTTNGLPLKIALLSGPDQSVPERRQKRPPNV